MRISLNSVLAVLMLVWTFEPASAAEPNPTPIVQAHNQFAFELYDRLANERAGKNLFLSPMSVSLALTMTAGGARGETKAEMLNVLHLTGSEAEAHAQYHNALERWRASDMSGGYVLKVANRMWARSGLSLQPDFLVLTSRTYGAELATVHFASNQEAVRRQMNAWVVAETQGKIKEIAGAGVPDSNSQLVLTNATYFKGDWTARFPRWNTQRKPFSTPSGARLVSLMHQTGNFRYYQDASMQALELPYKGGELALLVLLPNMAASLPDFEKTVSAPSVASLRSNLVSREVSVYLPKFSIRTSSMLAPALDALGMMRALGKDADFSGIAVPEPALKTLGMRRALGQGADLSGMARRSTLHLSAIVHEAFVDVNEDGTEAAAATSVFVGTLGSEWSRLTIFRADHPFLFMIYDTRDGSILFVGRLMNPDE